MNRLQSGLWFLTALKPGMTGSDFLSISTVCYVPNTMIHTRCNIPTLGMATSRPFCILKQNESFITNLFDTQDVK